MVDRVRGDFGQWHAWVEEFPIGANVNCEVIDVWQVGTHVQLDRGPEALLLNSELTWDAPVTDARTLLRKGQRITVQVVQIEPWRERAYVSLRRAVNDPWKQFSASYKRGKTAHARVTQFTGTDVEIEFEDHINGFVPRAEIARGVNRAEDILEIGDWIEVKVIDRDERTREVKASMKVRLEEIEAEIRNSLLAGETPGPPAEGDEPEEPEPLQEPVEVQQLPRILVVEDDKQQRLELSASLRTKRLTLW